MFARVTFGVTLMLVLAVCSNSTSAEQVATTTTQVATTTTVDTDVKVQALDPVGTLLAAGKRLSVGDYTTTEMTPLIRFSTERFWDFIGEFPSLLLLGQPAAQQSLAFVLFPVYLGEGVVESIQSESIFNASDVAPATVGGIDGVSFMVDVVVPGGGFAQTTLFPNNQTYSQVDLDPPRFNDGEQVRFTLIEVGENVLVIMAGSGPSGFGGFLAIVDELLATVTFGWIPDGSLICNSTCGLHLGRWRVGLQRHTKVDSVAAKLQGPSLGKLGAAGVAGTHALPEPIGSQMRGRVLSIVFPPQTAMRVMSLLERPPCRSIPRHQRLLDLQPMPQESLPIAVLISGSGTNLQALIDRQDEVFSIAVVIADRPDAFGLTRATDACIPIEVVQRSSYSTPEAFTDALCDTADRYGAAALVLAGFMRILTASAIERFPHAIINVHPALLPAFPGAHAVEQALAYGVTHTGVTVHFVDEQVDHGPIIAQRTVSVLAGDDQASLHARLQTVEHELLPEVVAAFARGALTVEGRHVRWKQTTQTEGVQ